MNSCKIEDVANDKNSAISGEKKEFEIVGKDARKKREFPGSANVTIIFNRLFETIIASTPANIPQSIRDQENLSASENHGKCNIVPLMEHSLLSLEKKWGKFHITFV
ncbi:hypothetical protein LOAG_09679 [Loa loa]|uniref:Uncharacterized protein n=1 Tax=Loa loa TaxID=7209 RepID=A0A1S0TRZ0_LOALO|nr:hypothetical protein LOAG_09679 [Loa loa]EFO18817.1 hypothetical protein LOAG_09679 [Loa loa]